MFKAWDKADPVDAWERKRAKRIEQIQGNVKCNGVRSAFGFCKGH